MGTWSWAAVACLAAFSLRGSAIILDIRMGPPGEFIRVGPESTPDSNETDIKRNMNGKIG